jgi:hypothetical protein
VIYKKLNKILDSLTALEYLVLLNISNNFDEDILNDTKYTETLESLRLKDYISLNNKLTLKGKDFLEELDKSEPLNKESGDVFEKLHSNLQQKMIKLTKQKQVYLQGKYPFLGNSRDLKLRLQKVIKKYNLTDFEKIEKVLTLYVEKCYANRFEMVSTVDYYILKGEFSKLVTDYENYDDIKSPVKKDTTINL